VFADELKHHGSLIVHSAPLEVLQHVALLDVVVVLGKCLFPRQAKLLVALHHLCVAFLPAQFSNPYRSMCTHDGLLYVLGLSFQPVRLSIGRPIRMTLLNSFQELLRIQLCTGTKVGDDRVDCEHSRVQGHDVRAIVGYILGLDHPAIFIFIILLLKSMLRSMSSVSITPILRLRRLGPEWSPARLSWMAGLVHASSWWLRR